jgi:hypothetical protein
VNSHARKLSHLLISMPEEVMTPLEYPKALFPEQLRDLIHRLQALHAATIPRFSSKRGPKVSPLALSNGWAIYLLGRLYLARTGKRAGAGRVRHHHNDVVVGEKPGGPFFRLLRASLSLVDDKQGDEAIFRAIQNHTRRMKTGDLFKKVRAAIADDPSSAEKLIDEATAEASRLGKRRPLKSPIRIRGTN